MDAEFARTWQEEAAANQAACVESAATIFDSVFSADGGHLISGAAASPPAAPRALGDPPFPSSTICVCSVSAGSSTGRIAVTDVSTMVRTKGGG